MNKFQIIQLHFGARLWHRDEEANVDRLSDVELARLLSNSLSGQCSEWPQLKPLLIRLADKVEDLERRMERARIELTVW